jgi:hypothetical protein
VSLARSAYIRRVETPGQAQAEVPAWLTRSVLGLAVAAGTVGVGLEVAGVHSLARVVLVLLFLAVAPTTAIGGLLNTADRFARVMIAVTADVCLIALIAIVMLAEGIWSPTGGLLAVAVVTAAGLVVQLPPVRRRLAAGASSCGQAVKHLAARARPRGTT